MDKQMFWKKAIWLGEDKRKEQLTKSGIGSRSAYFGFQRIPEEDKADRVLKHFNSVARHYDFMNTLLSFGIHHLWKRTAIRMLALTPGDRILDVCSGTGDLAIRAARNIGKFDRVIVYDINRAMINAGLHKVVNTPLEKQLQYVQGDAAQMPFPDLYFDSVMVGFGIRNVSNIEEGFSEMYRVLKPGGKMMCLEFSKPTAPAFLWLYDFYSFYLMPFIGEVFVGSRKAYTHLPESIRMFPMPDELSALLKKIGFARVRYQKLTNGIAVIHLAAK